jgi:hypothetical protein
MLGAFGQTAPTITLNAGYTQQDLATYSITCTSTSTQSIPMCGTPTGDVRTTSFTAGNNASTLGLMYGINGQPATGEQLLSLFTLFTVTPQGVASTFGTFNANNTCSVDPSQTTGTMTTNYLSVVGFNQSVRAFYVRISTQEETYQMTGTGAGTTYYPVCMNGVLFVSGNGTSAPTYTTTNQSTSYLIKIGVPLLAQ